MTIYSVLLKTGLLINAIRESVFIGLAIMGYEPTNMVSVLVNFGGLFTFILV